ncbi:MAG: type II toxin-antitoxin system HicA family toxin [Nanoarchaeota archaeon]
MAILPVVSGQEARKAFERLGWQFVRQVGSHMILTKQGMWASLSVPDHREVDRGTLRKLIRLAGITVEEFIAAL